MYTPTLKSVKSLVLPEICIRQVPCDLLFTCYTVCLVIPIKKSSIISDHFFSFIWIWGEFGYNIHGIDYHWLHDNDFWNVYLSYSGFADFDCLVHLPIDLVK